jgi:hypothetical protein
MPGTLQRLASMCLSRCYVCTSIEVGWYQVQDTDNCGDRTEGCLHWISPSWWTSFYVGYDAFVVPLFMASAALWHVVYFHWLLNIPRITMRLACRPARERRWNLHGRWCTSFGRVTSPPVADRHWHTFFYRHPKSTAWARAKQAHSPETCASTDSDG